MPNGSQNLDPESFVREAYALAERRDLEGWRACFIAGGTFVDNSIGVTYSKREDLDYPVRQYGAAFGDMHRELYNFWTVGNTVLVRLALQGTHTGPLETPFGTPTASAQLADQVKQQVGDDPGTFDRAYRKALTTLGAEYWGTVANPPPDRLKSAAVEAKSALEGEPASR